MNGLIDPVGLLFAVLTLALLAWPFYPAWREWREPSDDQPLPVENDRQALPTAAAALPVGGGAQHKPIPACAPEFGQRQLLIHLPHAQPWGDQGWRVQGDCHLPEDSRLPGPLVVSGNLTCGARSLVEGDVKVHGAIHLAPGSTLMGALFARTVTLAQGAQVFGPVVASATAHLGPDSAIGRPEQPASLSAAQVLADAHARVHGPVWTQAKALAP